MEKSDLIHILVDTADKPAEFRALMLNLSDDDLEDAVQVANLLSDSGDPHVRESGEALAHWCAYRKCRSDGEVSYWFVRCLLDRFRLPRH